jgi:hypothetical protein
MQPSGNTSNVIEIDLKVIGLVLLIFIGGLVSGTMLYQFLWKPGSSSIVAAEKLDVTAGDISYNNLYGSVAVIVAVNTGETDAKIEKITFRGIQCEWSNVYYWRTDSGPVSSIPQLSATDLTSSSVQIAVDGTNRTFQQATDQVDLANHWTIVLLVTNPGNITLGDVPSKMMFSLFTERGLYYQEIAVQTTYIFLATEQVGITNVSFQVGSPGSALVIANNTGTIAVTINEVWVNNVKQTVVNPLLPNSISANSGVAFNITLSIIAGYSYQFKLVSSKGNTFLYTATAPS